MYWLEIGGVVSTISLPLLSGLLLPEVVVPIRIALIGQINV